MDTQNIKILYLEASNSLSSFLNTPILLRSTGKTGKVWSPSYSQGLADLSEHILLPWLHKRTDRP